MPSPNILPEVYPVGAINRNLKQEPAVTLNVGYG